MFIKKFCGKGGLETSFSRFQFSKNPLQKGIGGGLRADLDKF